MPSEEVNEILKTTRGMEVAGQMAALDSISREKNIPQEKLKTFFDKIIKPNTNIVNFNLGIDFNKKNSILDMKHYMLNGFVKQGLDPTIQDIGVPETEDIDYSIVKEQKPNRYGEIVTLYKNGILIITDINPKGSFFFSLYNSALDNEHINVLNPIIRFEEATYYLQKEQADKLISHKDNITLYMVFRKAHKNKAYKFNLLNHKNISENIEFSVKQTEKEDGPGITIANIYRSLPQKALEDIAYMNGVLDLVEHHTHVDGKDIPENIDEVEKERILKAEKEKAGAISKQALLKSGFFLLFYAKIVNLITCLMILKKDDSLKGDFLEPFDDCENEKEMIDCLFQLLYNKKQYPNILREILYAKQTIHTEPFKDADKINSFTRRDVNEIFHEIVFMFCFTNEGTSLPGKGPIDTSNSTQIDCLYYWKHADLLSMFFGLVDHRDFPLFLEEGEVFNKRDLRGYVHEFRQAPSGHSKTLEIYNELSDKSREQCSLILNEAMSQTTGLLIPYNACVELRDDSVFRYARFVETDKFIHIFLHDEDDRYMSELFCKNESEFRYWLVNRRQIYDKSNNLKEMFDRLYVKLASCIRDFKILIERNRTMSVRSSPMTPNGVKTNRKRWIYLPRVKYIDNPDIEQKARRKNFFSESKKFSGERRAHIRRLPKGMKPSKTQLVIAENSGVYVPENYTFVKESVWGIKQMSTRQIKYRSSPLTNGILYMPDDEFKKNLDIAAMCPAKFEEYCEKYIVRLGFEVYKKWNYDGGIDIRGINKDGARLFVQCKHPIESGSPVGPDVVRELQGSVDLESMDMEECEIKKMIITSTRYTHKAVEAADKLNIKLLKTDDLE